MLSHITKPSIRAYLFILLIGLFVGLMAALPLTARAQESTPVPTVTPTETPAPTAEPVTQEQVDIVAGNAEDKPLDIPAGLTIIVSIIGLFASMPGVSLLQSALVNIGKAFGIVTDGNAPRAYALLTLVLFGVLVYFQLFQHTVDLAALDSALGQIGTIAAFVGASVTSLIIGPQTHAALVRLDAPLVSTSHSAPTVTPLTSHPPDYKRTR